MADEINRVVLSNRRSSRRDDDQIQFEQHSLLIGLQGQTELFSDRSYVNAEDSNERICFIC